MAERDPSIIKEGGYQGSADPGRPTSLMTHQIRPVEVAVPSQRGAANGSDGAPHGPKP